VANLNRIILVGRLTSDPDSRSTMDGLPMAKFRISVTRPFTSSQGEADFIDIVAWRKLAEYAGDNLAKGQLVLVEGRIQNRSFEDQTGQRRWVTEVVAKELKALEKAGANAASTNNAKEEEAVEDAGLASDLPF
jgi:single-strand DNA-binding protein